MTGFAEQGYSDGGVDALDTSSNYQSCRGLVMSTTFKVFPASRVNVKFGEVLELAQVHLNKFLDDFEIEENIELQAELIGESARKVAALDETFEWPQETYAWISIRNVPGGTDVYFETTRDENDPDEPWWRLDELKQAPNYSSALQERLRAARNHNIYWTFRRSAGQRAIINVAYGLIASSLAELTDGLIYSGDNAWDYKMLPTTGPELRSVYFRPNSTNEPDREDWVNWCISSMRSGVL